MKIPGALTEGFKRFMAAKGSAPAKASEVPEEVAPSKESVIPTETVLASESQDNLDDQDDQDDTVEDSSLEETLDKGPGPSLDTGVFEKRGYQFF